MFTQSSRCQICAARPLKRLIFPMGKMVDVALNLHVLSLDDAILQMYSIGTRAFSLILLFRTGLMRLWKGPSLSKVSAIELHQPKPMLSEPAWRSGLASWIFPEPALTS